MKVQELFADYLYQQKQLTLPGIGHFKLDSNINVYELKDHHWPENTVTFEYDPHALVDPSLIEFLSKQTGKMKPLTLSDLESHIYNGVQLLNIGKPFYIKGVGNLFKSQNGTYTFEQGHPVVEHLAGETGEYVLRDRTKAEEDKNKDIDFSHPERKGSRKFIITAGVFIMAGLMAWAVYMMLKQNQPDELPKSVEDTVDISSPMVNDSLMADSMASLPAIAADSSAAFAITQVTLETFTNKQRAVTRFEKLKSFGHAVSLQTADSISFTLKLNISKSITDTVKFKDSLTRLFGKPVSLQ